MQGPVRAGVAALVVLLAGPASARAEWQLRPFLGVTFGGHTTLYTDLEQGAGKRHTAVGLASGLMGNIFGVEADLAYVPGFFQSGSKHLVLASRVTTLTGNITVALPRRMTEYTLRPYVVGGAGLMYPATRNFGGTFDYSRTMPAVDVGGGVTGFLTRSVGVNWEVRHFQSIHGADVGRSHGVEQLSFWRANMALAIRY